MTALEAGKLGGLALDVFHTEPFPVDDPLLRHPNVIATPHVGGVTEVSYQNMAMILAANILRLVRGEQPENVVNGVVL